MVGFIFFIMFCVSSFTVWHICIYLQRSSQLTYKTPESNILTRGVLHIFPVILTLASSFFSHFWVCILENIRTLLVSSRNHIELVLDFRSSYVLSVWFLWNLGGTEISIFACGYTTRITAFYAGTYSLDPSHSFILATNVFRIVVCIPHYRAKSVRSGCFFD